LELSEFTSIAMWKNFLFACIAWTCLTFVGCTPEGNSLTGSITITFLNETQSNEPELFVRPMLFESSNDTLAIRDLAPIDMGDDKDAELLIDDLLPGSYLFKYRVEIPSSNFLGPEETKAFQIFAGQQFLLTIEI